MKLAYWMYAGPAHIGTLRVASSFKNVHAIMHAPLGDDYFNVMRSMLERERDFTPVTASIVDRHVLARGSQEKVVENIARKDKEERPDLIILTPTCTSSILQEDLQNFVDRAALESESDVILADVNHYRVNELQAADRTLEQVVRFYVEKAQKNNNLDTTRTPYPSANIIGVFTLGFHNQHDSRELKRLLSELGIQINEVIPEGGSVTKLNCLPKAWFNIVPYREVGLMTAQYLRDELGIPYVSTTPMGVVDTAAFITEIEGILNSVLSLTPSLHFVNKMNKAFALQAMQPGGHQTTDVGSIANSSGDPSKSIKDGVETKPHLLENIKTADKRFEVFDDGSMATSSLVSPNPSPNPQGGTNNRYNFTKYIEQQARYVSQAAWFSRSIDCQNLTGKKAVVFGDATHAASMTKILAREMGVRVSCAGTYCKHDADWFREQVQGFCDEVLITDDHTHVGDMIARIEPAAIFGTQMERHIGKRLDIPCGAISAPVHIQNFPLGYRPFLGYEGTNQIADLVYNSFTLGMEDHLLEIFGGHDTKEVINKSLSSADGVSWAPDGLAELNKIPGFVRGKIKRNTEKFARENNVTQITVEIMYAAKEAAGA